MDNNDGMVRFNGLYSTGISFTALAATKTYDASNQCSCPTPPMCDPSIVVDDLVALEIVK
jgi:hypothetical protein